MAAAAIPCSLHLLFTVLLLLFPATLSSSSQPSKSTPLADSKSALFIRTSCVATLYPKLCYTSLSSYAAAVQSDPSQLAVVAANITLARVRSVSAHVGSVLRSSQSAVDRRTLSALQDCKEALEDAEDLTSQSAGELTLLATAGGAEVAWHVDNALTWLSAALSNEDTCTDGFSPSGAFGPASGAVKADMVARVKKAKQLTSNALALVNNLIAHRR